MSLLARGASMLARRLGGEGGAAAESVTYTPRGGDAVALDGGWFGRVRSAVGGGDAPVFRLEGVECDFLVPAAALSAAGVDGPPKAGDRIDRGGVLYEASAPSGVPVWEWSDNFRSVYRVHLRRAAAAAAAAAADARFPDARFPAARFPDARFP